MVTIQKKSQATQSLYFEGPEQSLRLNCKDALFYDASGTTFLTAQGKPLDYIDVVILGAEILLGSVPSIDPLKLRDNDGPLQYQKGNIKLSTAPDVELAEAVYTHLLKVRGLLHAFITPSTYEKLDDKNLLNQKLVFHTSCHGVSVDRAQGGLSTYLFNLFTAGKAPYEVVTRIYFDDSHTGATGDIMKGVFFEPVEDVDPLDQVFLSTVKEVIETHEGEINLPLPRYMSQCVRLDNYFQQKAQVPILKARLLQALLSPYFEFDSTQFIKEPALLSSSSFLALDTSVKTLEALSKEAPF